ncbi:heme exporter protein CcmD [Lysobacter sp. F6437]|uniref:heme exporter protein CcmD n=1 Tax=Lysobacter sp. F6437 TaxID=3459296 RepID=UPI00403DFFBD
MSYQNYVIAAYAVFAIVLGWDYVATRLQIRRELANARRRAARQADRSTPKSPDELTR